MTQETALIVLAAGGTGGHIFPAEALARELLGRGYRVALVTDKRGTGFSSDIPVPVTRIFASAIGKGIIGKLRSIATMGFGTLQAWLLLRRLRPHAVVGFGGYPSVPTLYAAAKLGIPVVLHEQNAVLGRANKVMMGLATKIATSFPKVVGLSGSDKAVLTGNPVRPAFTALRSQPYTAPTDDGQMRILILGGSLGARVLSDIVPKAIGLLPEHRRRQILITQQCRKEDIENVRALYAGSGVEAELSPFFADVPQRMADAHVFIGRSGGSTVAELTAIGRPSILIPFPHGHAGEQTANAEAIAEAGGAWIIPEKMFTAESLAVRLESFLSLPESLTKAATAARSLGRITAADGLANCVNSVLSRQAHKERRNQKTM